MKITVINMSIILLLMCTLVACQRRTNSEQSTANKPYRSSYSSHSVTPAPQKSKPVRSSGGVGAWGYVAIILTIILSGLGVYYFIIFYPIVCKKERMYDVMEMTTV